MVEYNYGSLNLIQLIIVIFFSSLIFSAVGKKCNFNLKKLLFERRALNLFLFVLFYCIIAFLIFLSAFREIGAYGSYIGGYDAYGYKTFFHGKLSSTHFEFGYVLLNKFVRNFTSNYSVFLILVSAFMIYCLVTFLREIKCSNFFLIFLLICTYFSSFNTLRTTIAIFISLLVIINLWKKKYFISIVLGIIASSMHVSAVIIFPVIFLNYLFKSSKKISYYKIVFLILLMCFGSFLLAYFSINYLSSTAYESYINSGQLVINIYLFAALIFILAINNYSKLIEVNNINRTLIISLPIIFLVFPMQLVMVILYRMVEYFLPLIYTIMAQIWKINNKLVMRIMLMSLFIYKIIDFFANCKYLGIT